MAKLILSLDGSVIREVPLDKERVTIGRRPHNDIQIENLAVSGDHARVVTLLGDSFLEDLGSTNGTFVNGNPVQKHILQDNDVIEIGKYKLKYVAEVHAAVPAAPAEDLEKTMVIRPGARQAPSPATAPPAAPPASPPAAPPAAAVRILNGPSAGRELEFTKSMTTLGKAGHQVAAIMRRGQGYAIAHVEGTNFPAVNGRTLGTEAHPLNDHDVIELAGVKMEFFLKAQ